MNGIKAATLTRVKADVEDGLQHGEAMAMVSLYGVKDHDGDRVAKGAFDAFAEGFNAGDYPLPVVWQHGRELDHHIGEALELDPHAVDEQGREGLAVKLRFDIDNDIPRFRDNARQAYKNVKGRRVSQWSYAWDGDSTKLKDGSNELTNMKLAEVSPVLRGALSETSTLAIKQEDEPGEGTPAEESADAAAFAKAWAGIGEMVATDADLAEWLGDANGPDVAGIVTCIANYISNDVAVEAMTGEDDSLDTVYFKGRDPVALQARAELELPDLAAR
jgi:HK97 family phage prohead protease